MTDFVTRDGGTRTPLRFPFAPTQPWAVHTHHRDQPTLAILDPEGRYRCQTCGRVVGVCW